MLAKSVGLLGIAEEHTTLSRALSKLAEVEEKVDLIHVEQAENDFFIFEELIKDYIGLMQSIKVRTVYKINIYFIFSSENFGCDRTIFYTIST